MPRFLLALCLGGITMAAFGDEGMFLLNAPPAKPLQERYNFALTAPWLERAMKASVRFNNGGSGGFVSPRGLIVTNHHIAADALQKLTRPDRDLLRDGFHAKTLADELSCPDLELNVLQSIEDVTAAVNAAVAADLPPEQAFAARKAVMGKIEKESLDQTGLRSDVVTLYNGGQYHLYRYKKFTDVRLVFAPESAVAAFGGDVHNFEYPRWGFDVSFFRAYEHGQPAHVTHFFRWNPAGPSEGDLVFVSGHPGTTNRLETLTKLRHRRDQTLPLALARLRALEAALTQYGDRGPDERREATTDLHRVANARKALSGQFQGLLDQSILYRKASDEQSLRAKLPDGERSKYDAALGRVAGIQTKWAEFEREYGLLERGDAFFSELFGIARHIVRLSEDLPKPSAERRREYRDSNLESLKFQLFSPAPIHAGVERVKLGASLTLLAELLPGDGGPTKQVLDGQPPVRFAATLVAGTKLFDPAERRRLVDGGAAAVAASDDGMIRFARQVDRAATFAGVPIRKRFEEQVEEPERQAYAELSRLRFLALGTGVPPDATFTLRLAFGKVGGYDEDGHAIPFRTTFAGAFQKHAAQGGREPFTLPRRWIDGQSKVSADAPFNFVSTADTIGGNSGSPVLNRAGELVGINFDRNRHGLVRNFVYTDVGARHIAVHAGGVAEALRKLYDAGGLVDELLEAKP